MEPLSAQGALALFRVHSKSMCVISQLFPACSRQIFFRNTLEIVRGNCSITADNLSTADLPLPFTATFPLPPRASPPLHHDPLQSLSNAQNVIFYFALNVHQSQTTSASDVDILHLPLRQTHLQGLLTPH